MPNSDKRFARQKNCQLPSQILRTSLWSGISHHLSGPDAFAFTQNHVISTEEPVVIAGSDELPSWRLLLKHSVLPFFAFTVHHKGTKVPMICFISHLMLADAADSLNRVSRRAYSNPLLVQHTVEDPSLSNKVRSIYLAFNSWILSFVSHMQKSQLNKHTGELMANRVPSGSQVRLPFPNHDAKTKTVEHHIFDQKNGENPISTPPKTQWVLRISHNQINFRDFALSLQSSFHLSFALRCSLSVSFQYSLLPRIHLAVEAAIPSSPTLPKSIKSLSNVVCKGTITLFDVPFQISVLLFLKKPTNQQQWRKPSNKIDNKNHQHHLHVVGPFDKRFCRFTRCY